MRARPKERLPVLLFDVEGGVWLNVCATLRPVKVSTTTAYRAEIRRLTTAERRLLRRCLADAATEAWARLVA